MKNIILLIVMIGVLPAITFGGAKGARELCGVGSTECASGLQCIPSTYAKEGYGKFSKDGLCLPLKSLGEECSIGGVTKICATGLTCAPSNPVEMTALKGTCIQLDKIRPEQLASMGVVVLPPLSNPIKECKYLPGNYFFSVGRSDDCCGIMRKISKPNETNNFLTDIKYCDWVSAVDSKKVTSPSFCGTSENGAPLAWNALMQEDTPIGEPVSGTCAASNPHDSTVVLGPDPEFTFDDVQCMPVFKDEDLESRVGLTSDWQGVGDMRYWFTSFPTKNFYRVGDEAFILAYIWLFKNTDQDSLEGANFKARDLAKKLYDMFALHYSKGFQDGFTLMQELDKIKNCVSIQGPLGFQLRYQLSLIMEQAILGTIRAYQCGGVEKLNSTTLNCTSEDNAFFVQDFLNITSSAEKEFVRCADPVINGCQKNYYLYDWQDDKRGDFIVNTVSEASGENLWLYKATPFTNAMDIDTIIDPPVNTQWIPDQFKDNLKNLFADLNTKNPTVPIAMPTADGRDPNFHWQIILKPEKLVEAFPPQTNYEGKSFLHFHEKMPYITPASKAYHNTFGINPGASEQEYWNGPLTIASEAVRIMEHFSASDEPLKPLNIRGADLQYHLRQLHFLYHKDVVSQRLGRLIQYYGKKLDSIVMEKKCLVEKIKGLSKIAGIDTEAPDYDPAVIKLDMSRNSCNGSGNGNGGGGGGGGGSDSSAKGQSQALAMADGTQLPPGKVAPNQQNGSVGFADFNIQGTDMSQATMQGKNKSQSISLASLVKSKSTLNANGSNSAFAAAKLGMKKQKDASLLKLKKSSESGPKDPATIIDEQLNKLAKHVFKKDLMPISGNLNNLSHPSLSPAVEATEEPVAKSDVENIGKEVEKKFGVMPEERIKFGLDPKKAGNLGKTGNASAISNTGLSPEHEKEILDNIASEDLAENEDDTLWRKVTKAYIKNYKKLFSTKTR